MKKIILIWIAAAAVVQAEDAGKNVLARFDEALADALAGLYMTPADLSLRDDYLEKDGFRMAIVDRYLKSPLELVGFASTLADSAVENTVFRFFRESPYPAAVKPRPFVMAPPESTVAEYCDIGGLDFGTLYRLAYFIQKETRLRQNLTVVEERSATFDSIIFGLTVLLEEDVMDEFRSVDELDSIQRYEESWTKKLVDLLGNVDAGVPAVACLEFLDFIGDSILNSGPPPVFDGEYLEFTTPYGKVCIGDTASQYYYGDLFIVIDYGGDDTYLVQREGGHKSTYILDYGGDDSYNFERSRISPFALGMSIVADFAGDDIYSGGSWCIGAGLLGGGIWWDKSGDDRYFGDTFTMGAGCLGFGILRDDGGNDIYQAALFSQGFGFVAGAGVLYDRDGNDRYSAGGKYKDILRYSDHYLSLSQGFGYGIRPYLSGGVGLLVDNGGNDVYESDIFAQGCSYWWSLGVLSDKSGHDKYLSYQYAQGCGTHMTLGCLYDGSGNDLYFGKGLMQGCGHDRSFAALLDAAGDDNYIAYDLSQGAGSANGNGLLVDLQGNDAYVVKDAKNTQGYGNERRDYGSIGIMIDMGGRDSYAGGQGADSTWWSKAAWGIGMDK